MLRSVLSRWAADVMGASLKWNGLQELKTALRNMPEELAGEASHIVEATANGAAAEVRRAYPSKSGRLIGGVHVTHFEGGKVAAGAVLKSSAPHSHLFERGTRSRKTDKGWNRGSMPEAPENRKMVPIVVKARRRMYSLLTEMLRRAGFVIEGQP